MEIQIENGWLNMDEGRGGAFASEDVIDRYVQLEKAEGVC